MLPKEKFHVTWQKVGTHKIIFLEGRVRLENHSLPRIRVFVCAQVLMCASVWCAPGFMYAGK